MRITEIENIAEKILNESSAFENCTNVEHVAEYLGITIKPSDLGDDVSGMILLKDQKGVIVFNSSHHRVRQRFTIAHEIGHFVLHSDKMPLFIDKYHYALRDKNSSQGEYRLEKEANAFAAALLMPRSVIKEEIASLGFDLADDEDDALYKLVTKFEVSKQAMSFRLANLNIF